MAQTRRAASPVFSFANADGRRARPPATPPIELLAAALQAPAKVPQTTGATRTVAEAFIERNLRENRLSAAEVSRAIGVSVRSLHRAFEDSGDSVSSFIRLRRLSRARDDLTSGLTVSQVARRWHYTDPSHFSRSFKRHFGVNPSDLALLPGRIESGGRPDATPTWTVPVGRFV